MEILIGATFVAVIGLVTRRAIDRSQRRQKPAGAPVEPAPMLGVVLPVQRDGSDLDAKISTL